MQQDLGPTDEAMGEVVGGRLERLITRFSTPGTCLYASVESVDEVRFRWVSLSLVRRPNDAPALVYESRMVVLGTKGMSRLLSGTGRALFSPGSCMV